MRNFAMKKYSIIIGTLFVAICLLSIAAKPGHAYIVYPDDIYWGPDERTTAGDNTEDDTNAGTVKISDENPWSGNASLRLTVGSSEATVEENKDDWAFYTRTAESDSGWGLLSDVSALTFDWYRATETDSEYLSYDPWNLQTPVIRMLIQDGDQKSELVWEQYYTDSTSYGMQIGEWVTEDLIDQNFWRYSSATGYTTSSGEDMQNFGNNTLLADAISDWADSSWILGLDDNITKLLYSENAFVYGLSVGVGSAWPGEYLAYVDNIYLAFGEKIVLDDNFELPVPEPSTMILLGVGLATLIAGRRQRGRG